MHTLCLFHHTNTFHVHESVLKNLKGKKTMNKGGRKLICQLLKTMNTTNIKEESVTIFYHEEGQDKMNKFRFTWNFTFF